MKKQILVLILTFLFSFNLASQIKSGNNESINLLLDSLFNEKLFNGIVITSNINESNYYIKGYRDFDKKDTIVYSNVFGIASISKLYFNMIVLDLISQGNLDVNSKVVSFIPKIPDTSIRIIDLINHSSNISAKSYTKTKLKLKKVKSKEDFLDFIIENCFENIEKEKKYEYAPENYFLLTLIIEKVKAKPFEVVVNELLDSINLKNTFYRKLSYYSDSNTLMPTVDNKVVNKQNLEGEYNSITMMDEMIGNIGIFTTIEDISKFSNYIFNLSTERNDIIFKNCFSHSSIRFQKCFGFETREFNNTKFLSHGGYISGNRCELLLDITNKKMYFIINTNERGDNKDTEFVKFTSNLLVNKIRKLY